jgi:hypothetical protein
MYNRPKLATPDQRLSLLTVAMTASTEMYKENSRILGLLDDKAQKTATLAGIFLAAAFAFLRKDSLKDLAEMTGGPGIGLLTVAMALLVGCVFVAGLVIWAREYQLPPNPNAVLELCDILLAGELTDEDRENYIRDQTRSWNRALTVQDRVMEDKSQRLLVSQCLLIGGIASVVVLLGLLIFHG